jgi:hypothetical protein
LNQGPADLQSAALTTELCTQLVHHDPASQNWTAWPRSTLSNAAASMCYAESAMPVYSTVHKKPAGPVAQWIRHRPTEPGIAGSSPAGVIFHAESRRACSAKRSKQIKLQRSMYLNRVCVPSAHSASQLLLFRAPEKNKLLSNSMGRRN